MGKGDTRMGGMEVEEVPVHLPPQIPSQEPRYQIKPMEYVISALIGGLITTIVVTPLEVVKTRVQTQHAMRHKPTISKMCYVFHNGLMTHVCKPNTECVPKPGRDINNMRPLRGAMDALLKIVCGSGIAGLWSGLSPTLISALPSTIIYFLTYEYLNSSFSKLYTNSRQSSQTVETGLKGSFDLAQAPLAVPYFVPMASGICSRTIVVTAITPIEMVRIKMQSGYITYEELWRVMRTLVRQHGVLGLWRGWPPTVMRDAPFSGTYWATYESIKRSFAVTEPTFWFSFFSGAVSGALATFVTMPFDLITTHTQIELGQDVLYKDLSSGGKTKNADKARPSVFSRLADIYRQQGVRGLYMGVMPRILRVVPACAIMISTFEYSKAFFSHHKLDMK
ncbi:GL27056 [Drosophila persimilis]|uniref:GL27056 n=1 Tax=Drosophila persimilis TaxID=7234 RepID=B4HAP9_DROPE|nr:solute carrier family 25 member 40 isoform X1 [Drosophila persimilis]EDW37660.1 GL27056 [Drosophila persimilis]